MATSADAEWQPENDKQHVSGQNTLKQRHFGCFCVVAILYSAYIGEF